MVVIPAHWLVQSDPHWQWCHWLGGIPSTARHRGNDQSWNRHLYLLLVSQHWGCVNRTFSVSVTERKKLPDERQRALTADWLPGDTLREVKGHDGRGLRQSTARVLPQGVGLRLTGLTEIQRLLEGQMWCFQEMYVIICENKGQVWTDPIQSQLTQHHGPVVYIRLVGGAVTQMSTVLCHGSASVSEPFHPVLLIPLKPCLLG